MLGAAASRLGINNQEARENEDALPTKKDHPGGVVLFEPMRPLGEGRPAGLG